MNLATLLFPPEVVIAALVIVAAVVLVFFAIMIFETIKDWLKKTRKPRG